MTASQTRSTARHWRLLKNEYKSGLVAIDLLLGPVVVGASSETTVGNSPMLGDFSTDSALAGSDGFETVVESGTSWAGAASPIELFS